MKNRKIYKKVLSLAVVFMLIISSLTSAFGNPPHGLVFHYTESYSETMPDLYIGDTIILGSNGYEIAGYNLIGWNTKPNPNENNGNVFYPIGSVFTMVKNQEHLYAQWTANTNTAYTVKHYKEDLNADTYTLADTDDMTGTTGTPTEAVAKAYDGFTAQTFVQGTIAANGSTVVEIYYTRNSYTVTYSIDGIYFTNPSYATETYEYEASVTAIANPSETGFTFSGWTGVPVTMPAENVTVTGNFTAISSTVATYKVEHYKENLNEDNYTLADTDNMAGEIGATTIAEAKAYDGFTAQAFAQGTIDVDGSTIVKIYYTRNSYTVTYVIDGTYFTNPSYATETYEYEAAVTAVAEPSETGYTFAGWIGVPETMPVGNVVVTGHFIANTNTAYTVKHYKEDLNADTYTLADTDDMTGTTGTPTEAVAKVYDGFTAQAFVQETITANGSTVVEIYYTRNSYTVTYAIDGTYFTNPSYATETYEYEAPVTAIANPGETGFTFSGWTGVPVTMPAENVTVTGNFAAISSTVATYKVEHYKENLNADTYSLADTDNMAGDVGAYTAALAKEYPGFTAQAFAQGTIDEDGSTIVKIYYTRNSYTVTYAIDGTYFTNSSYATEIYEYEATVTAIANPSETGYTFTGWIGVPETMPAENVTVTGSYTKDPVEDPEDPEEPETPETPETPEETETPEEPLDIEDEEIPGGPVDTTAQTSENSDVDTEEPEANDDITVEDEQVPGGTLPFTAGFTAEAFYGLGTLVIAVGALMKRKSNKK